MRQYLFNVSIAIVSLNSPQMFSQQLTSGLQVSDLQPLCAPNPEPEALDTTPSPLVAVVETKLSEPTGLVGRVHSAVKEHGLYVFTYRGQNFFDSIDFPMLAGNPTVEAQFKMLNRHFKIRVFGHLLKRMPIEHLVVERLELISTIEAELELPHPSGPVHTDFAQPVLAKIHAPVPGRGAVVVDVDGRIFPLLTKNPTIRTKFDHLYRGDIARVRVKPQGTPQNPTHLLLDEEGEDSFVVLDRMKNCNDIRGTLQGTVVKFAKSPQISFDVFALRHRDQFGIEREWTLLSEDTEVFAGLRQKIAEAWDDNFETSVKDRNKMSNPRIQVRASGKFVVVSPFQANPQVYMTELGDLTVTVIPE